LRVPISKNVDPVVESLEISFQWRNELRDLGYTPVKNDDNNNKDKQGSHQLEVTLIAL